MASYVLTAIGDDRAGLVNALAEVVADHGGNWERSQMAELAGKFAGIVLVTVPDAAADALLAALHELDGVLEVQAQRGADDHEAPRRCSLQLLGSDRPGIVREISAVLAQAGVSIEQLATSTREAPMAGGMLFEAEAVLDIPAGLDADALEELLVTVARELMVDIEIDEI